MTAATWVQEYDPSITYSGAGWAAISAGWDNGTGNYLGSGSAGTGAAATSAVTGGQVTGFTSISAGGTGYVTGAGPIAYWTGGTRTAYGICTVSGGAVTGITILDGGGAGYTAGQAATFVNVGAKKTSTASDSLSFNTANIAGGAVPCRGIYLMGAFLSTSGKFAVSVDGIQQGDYFTQYGGFQSNGGYYRGLIPLLRPTSQSTDANHIVTITNAASNPGFLWVDAFLLLAGSKTTPTAGNLVVMGDSWAAGSGIGSYPKTVGIYAERLAGYIQAKSKRPITLFNKGVSGDMLIGRDSTHTGGQYRTITDALPNAPEFLTYLFGGNDLTSVSQAWPAADFGRNVFNALCLIEDIFDTSKMKIAFGTPGHFAPAVMQNNFGTPPTGFTMGNLVDNLEEAAVLTRQQIAMFDWCRVADVYAAMDGRTSLLVPNLANGGTTSDSGLHPNDTGHGVIAAEMTRALLNTGF